MKYETIKEAAQAWVREFNAYPIGVISKLCEYEEVEEVTPPTDYDRVSIWGGEHEGTDGEIVKRNGDKYVVLLDNGEKIEVDERDIYVERDDTLPMWGWMWAFGDSIDEEWLDRDDNLRVMADCGFRIYKQEDIGYLFGIDGAGYDFYSEHWIPLYKARGLHWHEEKEEEK